MIRTILLATSALALSVPAAAADRRVVSRPFVADDVVLIEGQAGIQASIAFSESEAIENVAIGDAGSWQVTPNKRANMLFVKPLAPRARTNMTVVTDKRTYFFDLVAAPTARPVYMLRFAYPPEPKPEGEQAAATIVPPKPEEKGLAEGETPIDPASLNFAWGRRGDARLLPAQVYDDGKMTYLTWPVDVPQPAILILDDKGNEGPVNYAVRGDAIVIEGVPAAILLRSGKASAQLEFRGPNAAAVRKKGK